MAEFPLLEEAKAETESEKIIRELRKFFPWYTGEIEKGDEEEMKTAFTD